MCGPGSLPRFGFRLPSRKHETRPVLIPLSWEEPSLSHREDVIRNPLGTLCLVHYFSPLPSGPHGRGGLFMIPSCLVLSRPIWSSPGQSSRVKSYHAESGLVPFCSFISAACLGLSCHARSSPVLSDPVAPCQVRSSPVLPRQARATMNPSSNREKSKGFGASIPASAFRVLLSAASTIVPICAA